MYTNIVSVQIQNDRQTHTLKNAHKAPFRTRAYTDIKGPLFSPSYRYSTGGLWCVHIYVSTTACLWVVLWETTMYSVNSCRHPRYSELIVTWVCVRVHCGLFLLERLWNNSTSTNNAQRSRTIVPLTAFVCGGGETGNEIMLRAPAVRTQGLAGPGQEENTNHLLGGFAGLMEMRNGLFRVMYQSEVESTVTPGTAISFLLSIFHSSSHSHEPSLNVTKCPCEIAHTK